MEYIVENKQHLEKAETAYKNFTKNFKDQIESIKVHSFNSMLLISLKPSWDHQLILPGNTTKITFQGEWIKVILDDATITVKPSDISKLEITFDKNIIL